MKVRPDAIETAREAARRSGLSLHQWINSAIIGTAAESGVRPRGAHGDPHAAARHSGLDAVNDRLDDRSRQSLLYGVDGGESRNDVPYMMTLEEVQW